MMYSGTTKGIDVFLMYYDVFLGALVGLDVRDFEVHGFWKGLFWISSSVAMACKCANVAACWLCSSCCVGLLQHTYCGS
jgi:hypothetical protein